MPEEVEDKYRTRHPTLWTVEALVWQYKEDEEGPSVQLGKRVQFAEVPDRPYAIAIAHFLLDRNAEEAAGRMSLEVHLHPPKRDLEGTYYEITEEALEQARKLGLGGEDEVRRMAREATTLPQPNLRHGRYALRAEDDVVVWVGLAERGRRKGK